MMDKPDGKTTTTFSILLLFLLYIRQLGSFIFWLWSILFQYSFVSLFLVKIMYYNLQIIYRHIQVPGEENSHEFHSR